MNNLFAGRFSHILPAAAMLLLALAAACAPDLPTASPTPVPTPTVLRVALALELGPIRPALSACAVKTGNAALLVFEALEPPFPGESTDLSLVLGDPGWEGVTSLLGFETIVAARSAQGDTAGLDADQLAALYTGSDANQEIWVPLEGSSSRQALDALLAGRSYSAEAFLSPDPGATIEALAANPDAIGVLPSAWVTPEIQPVLELGDLPVLALTAEQPAGHLRAILGCLQEAAVYQGK